jgi:hypothetical protein
MTEDRSNASLRLAVGKKRQKSEAEISSTKKETKSTKTQI